MPPVARGSASVTQPGAQRHGADAPAASSRGGGVQRRALGQRVVVHGAPVGVAGCARPRRRACRAHRGELRQRAGGGLRGVPRAGQQDRPARPRARLALQRGQVAHDAVLEGALVGRVDAAVAEQVGVAVGAGASITASACSIASLPSGPRRAAAETAARARRGSPIGLVLEQALAADREHARAQADAAARAAAARPPARAARRPARRRWAAPGRRARRGSAARCAARRSCPRRERAHVAPARARGRPPSGAAS